jgi:hypothetical protein
VEIFHVERVTAILDQPAMHSVRAQFLQISAAAPVVAEELPTPRPSSMWLRRHRVHLTIG